ncbi:MAG: FKBP-type peptidyl-prolyl cis-trans isomerase [Cytophagaceae bacterium]|nr:FKBP-type peptidyl-prolyl cis-trans isomerase [Cytophagaceae bacterium]MDW8457327.1 FKBP-type peptidyl-prolyl cis-trans isomerase [Cytophagaceae bacterium]
MKNFYLFNIVLIMLYACSPSYKTSDSGVQYRIIEDSSSSPNAEPGGMVYMYMKFANETDTFISWKNNPEPMKFEIPRQFPYKGSFEEGLTMLSAGDSAEFRVVNDSLYTKVFGEKTLPKSIKKGGYTTFYVRITNVISRDSVKSLYEKQMKEALEREMQFQLDTTTIAEYLRKRKIKYEKSLDGVYVEIQKKSTGITLQPGDTAKINYAGYLWDGKKFDSNEGKPPVVVILGESSVIKGWVSGLMKMKKGEKAKIYIPSRHAFGPYGNGNEVPPNAKLIYEIEVLK